jgi:D-glycero-alpha-D-manno-heptose-7-phosphate kinase
LCEGGEFDVRSSVELASGTDLRSSGPATFARTPLRVGFVGGGTDTAAFMQKGCGAVLNATLNLHVYCWVTEVTDPRSNFELLDFPAGASASPDDQKLHTAAWQWFAERHLASQAHGVRISTASDVPWGSGLGASSAMTVCILRALQEHFAESIGADVDLSRHRTALDAYEVERVYAKVPGGYQDHFAASYGGLNLFHFNSGSRVKAERIELEPSEEALLEASLMLAFSGQSRSDASLASYGRSWGELSMSQVGNLGRLAKLADQAASALKSHDMQGFFDVLEVSSEIKRRTNPRASDPSIRRLEEAALSSGARFTKPLGAGGGGFVLVAVHPQDRIRVQGALRERGIGVQAFAMDSKGPIVSGIRADSGAEVLGKATK